jgi:uncharacterized SAM-binding protein YcdF (DUF218 family)
VRSWVFAAAALLLAAAAVWLRSRRGRQPLVILLAGSAVGVMVAWALLDGYDLRKLAGALVMPVGLLWLGLGGLAFALSAAGLTRFAWAAWALWLGLALAGNGWVASTLVARLERDFDRVDPLALEPFDAVVVLGGGVTLNDEGQVTVSEAGDRVVLAARMVHLGRTRMLVTTGPLFPVGGPAVTSVPRMTARVWEELGVPGDRVVMVEGPTATREEVAALVDLVAAHGWRRVGLLTSAFHLRRATRLCRRAGLDVVPLPADFRGTVAVIRPAQLVPSGGALAEVQVACWELVGAAIGR